MKKTKFLLLAFVFLMLFSGFTYAFALEITYPPIPGIKNPSADGAGLPEYLVYWFSFTALLAGAIALVAFVIAGFQLILFNGNPGGQGDAKDRIKSAVLGLVLTLTAFLIIRTINPQLITPTLDSLSGVAGVFYTNGSEEKPAPQSESDTANVPEGFNSLLYKCSEQGPGEGPVLLVWKFAKKNFKEFIGNVERIPCGEGTPLSGALSFYIAYESPGVYFCLGGCAGDTCKGFMSHSFLTNQSELSDQFKNNVKSIQIVNDTENNFKFGFIPHKNIKYRGECEFPFINFDKEIACKDLSIDVASIDIFMYNEDPQSAGDGVIFYNKPFGYKTGAEAGFYHVTRDKIIQIANFGNGSSFVFDYTNINVPQEEKDACKNFNQCPGSAKVQGRYLVAFFSGKSQSSSSGSSSSSSSSSSGSSSGGSGGSSSSSSSSSGGGCPPSSFCMYVDAPGSEQYQANFFCKGKCSSCGYSGGSGSFSQSVSCSPGYVRVSCNCAGTTSPALLSLTGDNDCECPGGEPGTPGCYPPCPQATKQAGICQVFYQDISNLKAEEFIAEGRILNTINIIGIK